MFNFTRLQQVPFKDVLAEAVTWKERFKGWSVSKEERDRSIAVALVDIAYLKVENGCTGRKHEYLSEIVEHLEVSLKFVNDYYEVIEDIAYKAGESAMPDSTKCVRYRKVREMQTEAGERFQRFVQRSLVDIVI